MPKGAIPAGSPTAEDEKQIETGDLAASTALESSTSNGENTASPAEPSDAHGEGGAEKPEATPKAATPLDELRNRKVGNDAAEAGEESEVKAGADGVEPEAEAEVAGDETPAAGDEVAVDDAPAKDKAAAGKPAAAAPKPGDEADDPLKTLSPEARAHIGREASARIRELNGKWRGEEKARKADEPLVVRGRFLEQFEKDPQVPMTPQEIRSALEFAKLYKRGDEAALVALRESVAEIEGRLGVQSTPAAEQVEPFAGELPVSMQTLLDYGANEDDVRLLHAVRVQRAERERQAKAGGAQGSPVQRQVPQRQPAPPLQRQPAAAPQVNRYGHSLVASAAAGDAVVSFLKSQRIAEGPEMEKYFDAEITPRLAKYAQNGDLESIAPEERLRLVQIAHSAAIIEKRKLAVAQRDRARPVSGGTSPTPQTSQQRVSAATNPLAALRAKKVGR